MANLRLIKEIALQKGMTMKSVADKIGMTPVGLSLIVSKNNTDLATLEKISNALEVSPSVFFCDGIDNKETNSDCGVTSEMVDQSDEMNYLRELVITQKQLIELQGKMLSAK